MHAHAQTNSRSGMRRHQHAFLCIPMHIHAPVHAEATDTHKYRYAGMRVCAYAGMHTCQHTRSRTSRRMHRRTCTHNGRCSRRTPQPLPRATVPVSMMISQASVCAGMPSPPRRREHLQAPAHAHAIPRSHKSAIPEIKTYCTTVLNTDILHYRHSALQTYCDTAVSPSLIRTVLTS
jgi:hypothetical protein